MCLIKRCYNQTMKFTQPYLNYPQAMVQPIDFKLAEQHSVFLYVNMDLIQRCGWEALLSQEGCELLSGHQSSIECTPLALAYGGHQFGYFTRLGDGRACVIGRSHGLDVCLKGSGPTKYARGGDGLAPLPSLIKELLMSTALNALHVPSSRTLSITYHHKTAFREQAFPAGVLARCMRTNIRIGSIEYANLFHQEEGVKQVLNLAISQLMPSLSQEEDAFERFIKECCVWWGKLTAQWESVGFVHGVLNSDNVSLVYETIDFGPCAFMETMNHHHAYSSIDVLNRYAYANQNKVMRFNVSLFLNSCRSLLHGSIDDYLALFDESYETTLTYLTSRKLGLVQGDLQLWRSFLKCCEDNQLDFTDSFVALMNDRSSLYHTSDRLDAWLKEYENRIHTQAMSEEQRVTIMRQVNPLIVLRHDLVNTIIEQCLDQDFALLDELMVMIQDPFNPKYKHHPWFKPSISKIVTTCGT